MLFNVHMYFFFVDCAPIPYPTIRKIKQTYMKRFKSYINEVNGTFLDVLKAELEDMSVLTSSIESANGDKDLGSHHVPLSSCAYDYDGSSGQKIILNNSMM